MTPELSPNIVARILARHSISREKGSQMVCMRHGYQR